MAFSIQYNSFDIFCFKKSVDPVISIYLSIDDVIAFLIEIYLGFSTLIGQYRLRKDFINKIVFEKILGSLKIAVILEILS